MPAPLPTAPRAPRLPEGVRLYAIGDVHGRLDLLDALLDAIDRDGADADADADAAARPRETIELYLGDLIDRGPDSRGAVERVLGRMRDADAHADDARRVVSLLGNHEAMAARALLTGQGLGLWLENGGDAALASYGVDADALWRDALAARGGGTDAIAAARAALPPAHLDFFTERPRSFELGDYLFVHAGVRPGVALAEQDEEDFVWIREPFLSSKLDHGRVVVHGHTPSPEPVLRANRIGLDTGAVFGGPLTALRLEGETRRILQVGPARARNA